MKQKEKAKISPAFTKMLIKNNKKYSVFSQELQIL
jgi:hypothetical protein